MLVFLVRRRRSRGSRKKAEEKLTELLETVRTGQYVDPSKTTLGEWLTDWIDVSVKPTVRPASYVRYKGVIDNHVMKAPIAAIPLQKLRTSHIESYYASIPAGSRPVHHTVLRRRCERRRRNG